MAWWKYALLALFDVEGNFCLVKAYQDTSIISVQLLDCFTIPCVMVLSVLVLHAHYSTQKLMACGICLCGLGLLVWTDFQPQQQGQHPLRGDLLVLLGCVCYAVSNVSQEYIVKNFDRYEFLGMLGFFGFIFSAIQAAVLEREAIAAIPWHQWEVGACFLGFTACLFLLYFITPILMDRRSAVFFNLSVLTADFWTFVVAVVVFQGEFQVIYLAAATVIVVGLLIYNADVDQCKRCVRERTLKGESKFLILKDHHHPDCQHK